MRTFLCGLFEDEKFSQAEFWSRKSRVRILARVTCARVSRDSNPSHLRAHHQNTINCSPASSQARWTARESRLRMTPCPSQLQYRLNCFAVVPSHSRPTEQHARGLQLNREGLVAASSKPLSQKTSDLHRLTKFKIFNSSRYLLQAHKHETLQPNNVFI